MQPHDEAPFAHATSLLLGAPMPEPDSQDPAQLALLDAGSTTELVQAAALVGLDHPALGDLLASIALQLQVQSEMIRRLTSEVASLRQKVTHV